MNSLKEQYLDILSNGANLTALCNLTAETVGAPVAITLTTRTIIAKSKNYTKDLVDEYTSSLLLCSPDEIKTMDNNMERILYKKKAFIEIWPYLKHKRINCGCFYKNRMLAVIDSPIIEPNIHEDALSIIELAASMFTLALQLNSYIAPNITHPIQTYLIGLLRGDINEDFQQRNLYNSALETVSEWCVAWFQPTNFDGFEKLQHNISHFCNRHENVWFSDYETGYVILFDHKQISCLKKLAESCSEFSTISIGKSYRNLNETMANLRMAQFTVHLADFEDKKDSILFVETYKMPLLYLSHFQSAKREDYLNFTIDTMKKYDAEHASAYFPTLRAYLLHNMDCKRIAEVLHIHKNTVIYRIQRIEELFHIDLTDCRVITDLYLSLFSDFLDQNRLMP